MLTRIALVRPARHETPPLEAAQQPAEIAGIQPEIARDIGRGARSIVDEFVKDTHFRERKIALVEAFVKRAAMACIETVEAAYRLGRSKEIWTHHHSLVLSFV
jgi:hypothetical protein